MGEVRVLLELGVEGAGQLRHHGREPPPGTLLLRRQPARLLHDQMLPARETGRDELDIRKRIEVYR
ncbi:hypothetical protein GCM10022251_57420 [Phytohabitans flavus]